MKEGNDVSNKCYLQKLSSPISECYPGGNQPGPARRDNRDVRGRQAPA